MAKKVLLGLAAVVVLFAIVVATRPATYHIERTANVGASPAVVFAVVGDLHKFDEWSPWSKMDPQMKKTFEGPETGVGSKYSWVGNDEVGTGSMTVTAVVPNESITMALEFKEPMENTATVNLKLMPKGETTDITWGMDGNNGFMGKMFSMFMDMDKMVGDDFDKGLASLKTVSENNARQLAAAAAAPAEGAAPAGAAPADPAAAPAPAKKAQ